MERTNLFPVSLDLYLRVEDRQPCGVIHNLTLGKWAYFAGLDHLLLYMAALADSGSTADTAGEPRNGVIEIPEPFTGIPAKDFTKLELTITGNEHHSLQGQLACPGGNEPQSLSFASGLELMRLIRRRICE